MRAHRQAEHVRRLIAATQTEKKQIIKANYCWRWEQAGEADGQCSNSNGWRRAEKAQMGIYTNAGLQYRGKYVQPSQKMAACAVLGKKVYECKNIIANTGRRRKTVSEDKEIRSDHKEKSRRGVWFGTCQVRKTESW